MQPESVVKVSVVVPCKNDARYLTANLESILSQDYPCIECIVVDGGSIDGTVDLLERYGDRIRWTSEPDRGSFDAINRGWSLATGEILAWLNADDVWEPGAARKAVEFMGSRPEVDVVYGTAGVVDELGRRHGDMVPRPWDLEYALVHCDHIIFQPAAFMRRRILERVNWLYPAWCHDHDLWLRIARVGGVFAQVPDRLAMDRLRFENLGRIGEVVIPGKIGLTRRFFEDRSLPPNLQRLRGRAMSNAYLRALDYLDPDEPRHWLWGPELLMRAVLSDPTNVGALTARAMRPIRGRLGTLRERGLHLLAVGRHQSRRVIHGLLSIRPRTIRRSAVRLLQGASSDRAHPIEEHVRLLQRSVEKLRVETSKKIESLQQAHAKAATDGEALMLERQRLNDALASLAARQREVSESLAALQREHEALQEEVRRLSFAQSTLGSALSLRSSSLPSPALPLSGPTEDGEASESTKDRPSDAIVET